MPRIIASAVMITGRSRVVPAESAASWASSFSCSRCSFANWTTRIELLVATPTHMIAPISAGIEMFVCVTNSIQSTPDSAPGSAIRMISGSSHDWKLTAITR
jgi:hypothetical protein